MRFFQLVLNENWKEHQYVHTQFWLSVNIPLNATDKEFLHYGAIFLLLVTIRKHASTSS